MELEDIAECPRCLETMEPPIRQCTKGHSICGGCSEPTLLKQCPVCGNPMSTVRNYQLEKFIEVFKLESKMNCTFANRGCRYTLKATDMQLHEKECKFRTFRCEGKKFCGWDCNWKGYIDGIIDHFNSKHSVCEFKGNFMEKIDLRKSFKNIRAITFANGTHLLWFKYKIDVDKEKCYWVFQYVGSEKQAKNYYYEFEISNGPIRKWKVTEICENDVKDTEEIFQSERCIVLPFNVIKSYLNENEELTLRYRVMKIEKACDATSEVVNKHLTAMASRSRRKH